MTDRSEDIKRYPSKSRRTLRFLLSGGCLLIVLALGNLLAAQWMSAHWDLTREESQSLSRQTRTVLNELNGEVTVSIVASPNIRTTGERRFQRATGMLDDLLQRYQQHCSDLTIHRLAANESLAARQLRERFPDVIAPCVVVTYSSTGTNDIKHEVLTSDDLVEFHGSPDGDLSRVDFFGEQALTAALQRLSSNRPQTIVYYLTGHGELFLDEEASTSVRSASELADRLSLADMELRPLDLSIAAAVPSDADIVLIAGPRQAIAQSEATKLDTYFKHGGSGLMLIDLVTNNQHRVRATGMEGLLREYGLLLGNDFVVTASLGSDLSTACSALAAGVEHPLMRSLPRTALELQQCRSVRLLPGAASRRFQCTPLLISPATPHCWAEGNLDPSVTPSPGGHNDLPGPISLAAAVERTDRAKPEPMLVVVGDAEFACNRGLTEQSGEAANRFLVASLNWLAGRKQRSSDIPVQHRRPYLLPGTPQEQRGLVWKSTLFLSALIVTAGATVWTSRR